MDEDFHNIFQDSLPISPWDDPRLKRLPGLNPMSRADWVIVDTAFDRQMAYADHLLATKRDKVLMVDDSAHEGERELLEHLLAAVALIDGYDVGVNEVIRPDGVGVFIDLENPMFTARSLVQQDLCVMQRRGNEHVLTAGAMCFPASWTLSEKFMRPMTAIHDPVEDYGSDLARRVERMFAMMRPEQDMWRANWLVYSDPHLHQPRRGGEGRPHDPLSEQWMRVERQSFCKLPKSEAVVFGIHSIVVPFDRLTRDERVSLRAVLAGG